MAMQYQRYPYRQQNSYERYKRDITTLDHGVLITCSGSYLG
ncbi:hypothetical protein MGWOODY_Tha645 [hydrothermal vent metagenome]|uniref:Uncharacterized protein n=1 Tax=hydrothermal vent metagenome TaxID=652676 RepID=A0A170PLA6_9ZZZZ